MSFSAAHLDCVFGILVLVNVFWLVGLVRAWVLFFCFLKLFFNVKIKSVVNTQSLEPTCRKRCGLQGWGKKSIISRIPVTMAAEADWQVLCKGNNVT